MYAVIKTGGKQYKVSPGDVLEVEHLKVKGDDTRVTLTPLMVVTDQSETVTSAKQLSDFPVSAKILGDAKGDKVTVFKYRPKSGYASKTGHRQLYSVIQITSIGDTEAAELKTAEDVEPETTGQQKPAPVQKKEPAAEPTEAIASTQAEASEPGSSPAETTGSAAGEPAAMAEPDVAGRTEPAKADDGSGTGEKTEPAGSSD